MSNLCICNKWGSTLLFLIYINDLDSGISSHTSKFTDDSMIGTIIGSESDVKDLQGDLDRLNECVIRWQLDFNHDKCRVMNVGRENPHNRYNISKVTLNISECENILAYRLALTSVLEARKM